MNNIDLEGLKKFLYKANENGYAGDGNEVMAQRPGFEEIEYKDSDYLFHDSYAGSYFAPGQEVVYYKNKPIWAMAYAGGMNFRLHDDREMAKKTFEFLKKALLKMDPEKPFRGPEDFEENDFKYHSHLMGDIKDFAGSEVIFYQDKEVFSQNFIGGVIVDK